MYDLHRLCLSSHPAILGTVTVSRSLPLLQASHTYLQRQRGKETLDTFLQDLVTSSFMSCEAIEKTPGSLTGRVNPGLLSPGGEPWKQMA